MGINYDLYHKAASKIQVRDAVEKYRRLFGDRKLILSVDRLDYSKGILHPCTASRPFWSAIPNTEAKRLSPW